MNWKVILLRVTVLAVCGGIVGAGTVWFANVWWDSVKGTGGIQEGLATMFGWLVGAPEITTGINAYLINAIIGAVSFAVLTILFVLLKAAFGK
jgi:hypothetical protein